MIRGFFFLLFFLGIAIAASSQSALITPDQSYNHLIHRYEILSGDFFKSIHTTTQPYYRNHIVNALDRVNQSRIIQSRSDSFNIQYLKNDNWEWADDSTGDAKQPVFKHFYKKKNALFHKNTEDFMLQANPVMNLQAGKTNNTDRFLYTNTRGIKLRGSIDNKVGFYTFLTDNQAFYPRYINQRIDSTNAVPGANFNKTFKEEGYDFFNIRGYVTLNATKNIGVQFGHDRHFIGQGYRSLILSDFSGSYLFLKLNTQLWRFKYTNLFTQMTGNVPTFSNDLLPKKYMAFHHLSFNITNNVNIGVFESIVFGREDSLKNGTFELSYLNPVIFYRAVESNLGSKDNALLGMDFKWNFLNHFSLYGQAVLDEFLLRHIKERNGWWANKYALQAGLKYINAAGIPNLDLQTEINVVRPFTYAHNSDYTNYSHFHQPLAHPLGSNFREFLTVIRYQPFPRFNITAKYFNIIKGQDPADKNLGNNILKDYSTHTKKFNNNLLQGLKSNINLYNFTFSYQLKHNFFIDLNYMIRNEVNEKLGNSNLHYPSLGIRWNVEKTIHEF